MLLLLIIARLLLHLLLLWVSTAYLRELIRRSCECLLPIGWRYLVLLKEVDADVSLVDLGATNDTNLGVHYHVVWDRKWLKVLAKLVDLLDVVLVQHLLFLLAQKICIRVKRGTYIAF